MAGGAPRIQINNEIIIALVGLNDLHSAAYTGTVELLGPIPRPKKNRAMKRCCHEFVTPCQTQVKKENAAVMKIVPRRPNILLSCH